MAVHGLVEIDAGAPAEMDEEHRRVGLDVLKAEDGGQDEDEEEKADATREMDSYFQSPGR